MREEEKEVYNVGEGREDVIAMMEDGEQAEARQKMEDVSPSGH